MKGIVSFYEKPECMSNKEQKDKLRNAGYILQVINILEKDWDRDSLLKFFKGNKIHDCINYTAPMIENRSFDPGSLSEEELLTEMIKNPILIKRPLLFFRGEFACGFNNELVTKLLGKEEKDTSCLNKKSNCS